MSKAYLRGWFHFPLDKLSGDQLQYFKNLIYTSPFLDDNGKRKTIPLYQLTDTHIQLPIPWVKKNFPNLYNLAEDNRVTPGTLTYTKLPDPNHPSVKDPKGQKKFMDDLLETIKKEEQVFAVAKTGSGKTVCALRTAALLGHRTLVLVDKNKLKDQWIAQIIDKLGVPMERIGIIQQDLCEWEDKDVVVGLLHTNARREYSDDVYNAFGTVIVDECYHPSHDVLTLGGWKNITELSENDFVAQFNSQTGTTNFVKPSRLIKKEFNGNLKHIKSGKFDILVTPNHMQPVLHKNVYGWNDKRVTCDTKFNSKYAFPVAALSEGNSDFYPQHRLEIAFQADGHLLRTDQNGINTYRFVFRRERKIEAFRRILKSLNVEFNETVNKRGDTNFVFKSEVNLSKDFSWVGYERGNEFYEKFIEETTKWDGSVSDTSFMYNSKDEVNAEFVQTFAQLAGYNASLKKQNNKNGSINYRVTWKQKSVWVNTRVQTENVPYNGYVFCVTVPTGNIITRRNSIVSISGNCDVIATEFFNDVLPKFNAKYRIGLTATPNRKDGSDIVMVMQLGEVSVKSEAEVLPVKVHVRKYYAEGKIWGKDENQQALCVSKDKNFNAILAADIKKCYESGRNILVVSERIDQVEILMKMVQELGVPSSDMGQFTAERSKYDRTYDWKVIGRRKTTNDELDQALKTRITFATIGMVRRAIDVPRWDTLFEASPFWTGEQLIGRVRRPCPGKKYPLVFTYRHMKSKFMEDRYYSRVQEYITAGAQVLHH